MRNRCHQSLQWNTGCSRKKTAGCRPKDKHSTPAQTARAGARRRPACNLGAPCLPRTLRVGAPMAERFDK
jgi:hypothetical protein